MKYQAGLTGLLLLSLAQGGLAADEATVRVIVKYKQSTAQPSLKKQLNQTVNLPLSMLQPIAGGAYVLTFDSRNLQLAGSEKVDATALVLKQLRKNPNVIYALKDRVGHFNPVPNPKLDDSSVRLSHDIQWDEFSPPAGMMLESAAGRSDGAWAYTRGMAAQPIVVAVLDTGIELNTSLINNLVKDKQGNVWGWNFAGNNTDVHDETNSYHGTHVAGTIAGYGDVMLGVGEHLSILPVKIPDSSGMFYESQVINAIYWSVGGNVPGVPTNPYPAKVLNMSFGVDERLGKEIAHCDEALQDALFFARSKGAVITVAAGNENRWEYYNAPAVCNGAIKVASTGPEGLRAYYSNYGPSVSFAAPGGDLHYGLQGGILSTVNPGGGFQGSGFDFYQGTSMASPHAAGVAGLIFAASQSNLTPEKVEQILYATTHAFGESNDSNNSCIGKKPCGSGILDAENAVKAAVANYDLILKLPTVSSLSLKACAKDSFQPQSAALISGKAQWLPVKTACQSKANFTQPQLQQTKDGKILAKFGAVSYRLNDNLYKHCQIIGVNGIGCYL